MFLNATNLIGLNTDTFKNASIILYYHDHNRIIIVIIVYYCDGHNDIGVASFPRSPPFLVNLPPHTMLMHPFHDSIMRGLLPPSCFFMLQHNSYYMVKVKKGGGDINKRTQ